MRFEIENELKKLEWFKERNGGVISMDKDLKLYQRKVDAITAGELCKLQEAEAVFNLECAPAIEDLIDEAMSSIMTQEQLNIFKKYNLVYIKTEDI